MLNHAQVLELAQGFPLKVARPAELIIEQEGEASELYILQSGTVEIRRNSQLVAVVDDPGSTLGEVSMLLESPSTADVVARDEVHLRVVADPEKFFAEHPALALFIARQFATRLARVTDYLADLRDEFDDDDSQMGLVPQIVSELLTWRRVTAEATEQYLAEEAAARQATEPAASEAEA